MAWVDKLQKKLSCVHVDTDLSKYTTIGIGGVCKSLVLPTCRDEICKTIDFCIQNDVSYKVVGNMSNLIVSSDGFDGVVVKLGKSFGEVKLCGDKIFAQAGASTKKLFNFATQHGFGGCEFLATLPATVGGVTKNNAGCFGREAKDVVSRVFVTDGRQVFTFNNKQCAFGYRQSVFKQNSLVITGVEFRLQAQDQNETKRVYNKLLQLKKDSQPLNEKSAGSVFKRVEGVSAGYYIDRCGLKGFSVGDAQVSTKHAGFIVNKGCATSHDFKKLVCLITEKCKQTFGIVLVPEVEFLENTDDFGRLSYTHGF